MVASGRAALSPTLYVHRLADDMRFFADHGMLFTDFDCLENFWSTNGLNYYVVAKLLWDPYEDVDEIIAEYCEAGFGPAAQQRFAELGQVREERLQQLGRSWALNPPFLVKLGF